MQNDIDMALFLLSSKQKEGKEFNMNYSAIVLAAGSGKRTGLAFNKVLYPYQNRPILDYSLDRFEADEECRQIVVVVANHEKEEMEKQFARTKTVFTVGGKERQDSVLNGLKLVCEEYVLIHDGARPFVSKDLIERIKTALNTHRAVVPGIEVVDTIKEIDDEGYFSRSLIRSHLRAVQTPQAFSTDLIVQALRQVKEKKLSVTDDAMAVELMMQVRSFCVAGDLANFKVTSPLDLQQLENQEQQRAAQ